MIQDSWRRIAGIHVEEDGTIGAVWLAHDKETDKVHVYNAAVFEREVPAVIAKGISALGRWIPAVCNHEEMGKTLLDEGCNILPDIPKEDQAIAEVLSREIWERMRTKRFGLDKTLKQVWLKEAESFRREDAKVPLGGYPLMSATRHATQFLDYAKPLSRRKRYQKNYPEIAVI